MALSLDEALGMSLADEADESIHVDVNTRQITIPESQKLFGVESDADVEVKHIVIDGRYADGNRDLSKLAWRVIYRNANKETSYYLIPSVVANENSIEMDWLIKRSVVAYKGTVDFILCAFATTSSGEVTPEWNSTLGQGIVLEGLETSAIDIGKESVDELSKILYETITARDAAAKSAEEAKASTPASTLDGMYTAMLDGTNTQKIFKLWWPFAVTQSENKYSCLERFAAMLDTAWGDKTYTVRNIHESVSGDASGTPLDDLADGRGAAPLVTDASTGVADWAENDPMTWYVRANAKSLADGTMEVLAVETEAAFDVTGETAPVYCFSPALAVKEWDDGSYLYTSWHMRAGDGYVPMAGDVAPDGTHRLLTWHPAFYGGKNSAGGMTSGAGLLPMPWTSANAALSLARKLTAYDGLWCDCDAQFALMAWRLRHWTLSNSGQLEGCTNYNYQYTLAAAETGVKRVLLTKAQGANLLVGSCVCLGERGSNTNNDRNQAYNHDVFNVAKILSVETVTVDDTEYAAVNLDLASTIDTTTTMLVSTMPWPNGTTEALPGHSDGCIGNLTNGRYPYRIAGMEMQIGSYCEELDPLWKASLVDDDHWHYDVYSCRDSEKLVGSITANYQKVGEFDLPNANKWSWNYIRALNKMAAEAQIPTKFGGSSSTYVKAAFLSPGGAGVFAPWRFGSLDGGTLCGLSCARGAYAPDRSDWNGVPRLAGSGKKRGEWPA